MSDSNLFLINNIKNKLKLKLKLTDDIQNIQYSVVNLFEEYYTYINSDIYLQILADEYQFLTYDKIIKFQHTYVQNYRTNKFTTKYENILFTNNILTINNNIIMPIVPVIYQIGDNALYYFYLTVQNDLPKNTMEIKGLTYAADTARQR
jgi:chromosome segregation and condensation protein ScpB